MAFFLFRIPSIGYLEFGCLLTAIKNNFGFESPRNKSEMENPKSEILFVVARPGFEPRQTVPKTVVLPLYYQAISFGLLSIPKRNANIGRFFCSQKGF